MKSKTTEPLNFKYRKIQKGASLLGRSGLYLGDDHLLLVNNMRFTEEYRRFFLNEIEGITVKRTSTRLVYTVTLSVLLGTILLIGIILSLTSSSPEAIITCSVIGAFPLLLLILNLAFGPTVECKIRTTASSETLGFIKRLRQYKKLLSKISPTIEEAQEGRLDQSHLEGHFPHVEGMQWQR